MDYKLIKYTNEHFDEESALYDIIKKTVICHGDYYHDKIDEYISGIISGLTYDGSIVDMEYIIIDHNHEMFEICNFCGDEIDDTEDIIINIEDNYIQDNLEIEEELDLIKEVEIKEEIQEKKYVHWIAEIRSYSGDRELMNNHISELINETMSMEGDLYINDNIVWSCIGLDDECNAEILLRYGIECYDDYNRFRMVEECSCGNVDPKEVGEEGYRPHMFICNNCGCGINK